MSLLILLVSPAFTLLHKHICTCYGLGSTLGKDRWVLFVILAMAYPEFIASYCVLGIFISPAFSREPLFVSTFHIYCINNKLLTVVHSYIYSPFHFLYYTLKPLDWGVTLVEHSQHGDTAHIYRVVGELLQVAELGAVSKV